MMDAPPPLLWNGAPGRGHTTIILAHGAGAAMDCKFMNDFAAGLAEAGFAVARFEFPYMHKRRLGVGRSGAPDPTPVLLETWRRAIAAVDAAGVSRRALVISGKSLGGRMASMVADDEGTLGLACLGYPFHPPGKPATAARLEHLATLSTPTLIVQGTRDQFGNQDEVAGYPLSRAIRLHWLPDGDHSLKPRQRRSGRTEKQNVAEAIAAVATFANDLAETPRPL
ncbi:MAG: alpha/beta hydrolase [Alphaproteobacteria bacterium]|nr:alpha/beta hydrolase [Alphaproteobacteria bacterium]